MKPIFIFRHIECEGPGYLGEVLERRGLAYRLIRIDQGEAVPATVDGAAALVFMGGPMSVNDPMPWIAQELDLIRQAAQARMPVLGHCLGGQLMAKALGARVTANPVREIGWFPVEVVRAGGEVPWLEGLPDRFQAFHWHGETFTLPAGASHLLRNDACENQAFVTDRMLAFQCHVEMTAHMVREWADFYRSEIANPSATIQGYQAMQQDLNERVAQSQAVADLCYDGWLQGLHAGS